MDKHTHRLGAEEDSQTARILLELLCLGNTLNQLTNKLDHLRTTIRHVDSQFQCLVDLHASKRES